MAYQAIYRKWRPLVFEDIVGQTHITRTLKNQILTGKIAHAYLFCGTRGTGKTTAAKVFSRAVNCLNNTTGSPCNECAVCRGILDGSILEVSELDAASNNSVEDIRAIQDELAYSATQSKYRVYIIDEVHMLSISAFNALLKTLEEPPEHVIFILATTEVHKLPQTILSRCQRFDFRRIKPSDIVLRMREIASGDGLQITDGAYLMLARLADGSMRDGLSILERCISACGNSLNEDDIISVLGIAASDLIFRIADGVIDGNTKEVLSVINELMADGRDINNFADNVIAHFRDLLICKVSDNPKDVLDYSDDDIVKLKSQSNKASFEKITYATNLLSKARGDAKWVKNPRVIYELAFVKLTRPELDNSNEALLARVSEMEEKIKNGIEVKTVSVEKPKVEKKPKVKKEKPSERIFKPIDLSVMTAENPIAVTAKKWDKIVQGILKRAPHFMLLKNKDVTIDGEGIIILFEKNELVSKAILDKSLDSLEDMVSSAAGVDVRVKTAVRDDIEDYIIDFWNLPSGGNNEQTKPDKTETVQISESEQSQADIVEKEDIKQENSFADPIDELIETYPEIVEVTDDSEFINYSADSEVYEQKSIDDNDDDDEREEFLEESEIKQENKENED